MGGFTPILNGVSQAVKLGATINNVAGMINGITGGQDRTAEKILKREQALEEKQAAQRAAAEKLKIQTDADAATRARQDALRRAVSRRRAEFGASGISSNDGSGEAVLLGLIDDDAKTQDENDTLTRLRMTALDDSLAQQRARNLLELSNLRSRNSVSKSGFFF